MVNLLLNVSTSDVISFGGLDFSNLFLSLYFWAYMIVLALLVASSARFPFSIIVHQGSDIFKTKFFYEFGFMKKDEGLGFRRKLLMCMYVLNICSGFFSWIVVGVDGYKALFIVMLITALFVLFTFFEWTLVTLLTRIVIFILYGVGFIVYFIIALLYFSFKSWLAYLCKYFKGIVWK